MNQDSELIGKLVLKFAETIEQHKDHLTQLDQAIGDGDHGLNMSRGFSALKEKRGEFASLPFDQACKQAGMILVMTVGGASGPLFGSCVMAFGKGRAEIPASAKDVAAMLLDGAEAIKARGKSDIGAKTLLDVLIPVAEHIRDNPNSPISEIRQITANALAATKPLLATKGRAAFLGQRSIGHIDPGAQSVALIINSACDVLEAAQ